MLVCENVDVELIMTQIKPQSCKTLKIEVIVVTSQK